jgi:protein N-terminal amidase
METLSYWLARMEPIIRAETEGEIICVFANRTGTEEEAVYAGTSAVLGIHAGEVKVYGILGRGERELLVVDTNKRPQAKLVSEPNSVASEVPQSPTLKDIPDSRTNSTFSDISGVSVDTKNTTVTIPDDHEASKSIDEIITPLSPVNAGSPSAFFVSKGRRLEAEILHEALKMSTAQKELTSAQSNPPPPTFQRPSSPKSRNASRTRQPEAQESVLITHDLPQKGQVAQYNIGVESPQLPHTAVGTSEQFQSGFSNSFFGPRSAHTSPRPRSTVW